MWLPGQGDHLSNACITLGSWTNRGRIWLVDLTREVPPTVEMEGLDISISQCPPAQWLPQNVKMREWDMFTEPSEDLVGKFDIVHIRLVFLVIKNDDPKRLISNLHKLLSEWSRYHHRYHSLD